MFLHPYLRRAAAARHGWCSPSSTAWLGAEQAADAGVRTHPASTGTLAKSSGRRACSTRWCSPGPHSLVHGLAQVDGAQHVVVVIAQRVLYALIHVLATRKVDHAVKPAKDGQACTKVAQRVGSSDPNDTSLPSSTCHKQQAAVAQLQRHACCPQKESSCSLLCSEGLLQILNVTQVTLQNGNPQSNAVLSSGKQLFCAVPVQVGSPAVNR